MSIKFQCNDEVRRLKTLDCDTYESAKASVMTMFNINHEISLSWIDEENDIVVVSSDVEYFEALRIMGSISV